MTLCAGLLFLSASCGAGTVDTSADDAATLVRFQADLDGKDHLNEQLRDELAEKKDELMTAESQARTAESDLSEAKAQVLTQKERADAAEVALVEIQTKYDPEIRTAAQASWNAEVERACAEAAGSANDFRFYVDYTDDLRVIGTESDLVAEVGACAQPLRDRSQEDRLNSECEPGSVDAVIKGPDAFIGDCLTMYVIPWQWDSRTGECNFLGSWDPRNLGVRYRYKYDGDGLFRADQSVCASDLTEADQEDLMKVWVTVRGVYRYDTAAGGTNEIPDFEIQKAELVAKG